MEPLTGGFLKNIDETEFGSDIKPRRNGSKHAIPNPYSTSEARSTCGCVVVMFLMWNSYRARTRSPRAYGTVESH